MQFLRTVIFYVLLACVCIIGSLLILLAATFLPFRYRFRLVKYCNSLVIIAMRYICGIDFQVQGIEHIDRTQPMVVVSNHQSDWETFYLLTVGVPLSTVLKKELLKIPFFGWALALLSPIAINRSNKSGALKQLVSQGCQHLKNGVSVLIFPEGTRVSPGQLGPCNKGAALLASKAQVPILPVVQNSGHLCSPKRFVKKKGLVRVRFGEPIAVEKTQYMHDKMESWLAENLQDIDQNSV